MKTAKFLFLFCLMNVVMILSPDVGSAQQWQPYDPTAKMVSYNLNKFNMSEQNFNRWENLERINLQGLRFSDKVSVDTIRRDPLRPVPSRTAKAVPELDPKNSNMVFVLLAGAVAVMSGRKQKSVS